MFYYGFIYVRLTYTNEYYDLDSSMQLKEYRTLTKLSYQGLADLLGLKHANEAMRYCKGIRFPRPDILIQIEDRTNKAVTANDFINMYRDKNGCSKL